MIKYLDLCNQFPSEISGRWIWDQNVIIEDTRLWHSYSWYMWKNHWLNEFLSLLSSFIELTWPGQLRTLLSEYKILNKVWVFEVRLSLASLNSLVDVVEFSLLADNHGFKNWRWVWDFMQMLSLYMSLL